MKKLLIIASCSLLLMGCGDKLPYECKEMFNSYDNYLDHMKANNAPKHIMEDLSVQRSRLKKELKKLTVDEQIKFCEPQIAFFGKNR